MRINHLRSKKGEFAALRHARDLAMVHQNGGRERRCTPVARLLR
ncbi:hypothetical protein [Hydrogenophaga sp.]|nr:hypothetical protein [Hydrogenophaga sp.]